MGFSDLPIIERSDVFLDIAFKKARDAARNHTLADYEKSALNKEKTLSLVKLKAVRESLSKQLQLIIDKYPNFDNLHEFYAKLLRLTLDYKQLKKTLGSVNWLLGQVRDFTKSYNLKVKRAQDPATIKKLMNEYYGRISSVFKQVKKEFEYLHKARQVMRNYPLIKENMLTICLAGFPNVGKSTLLSKLTPAKPEINEYAFTTKRLNLGYKSLNAIKIQFIDTPGTLNRPEKMNPVEIQAYLAMRYVANFIVYVFDLTEHTYSIKDQLKLLERLKEYDKPLFAYISKQDLITEGDIEQFKEKYFSNKKIPLHLDMEELTEELLIVYKKELL
ncbi:MAG: 50S ribosome-binding GTPase [Nanoarchaeota archaeon]|nr:50S ribosome-binding GTPase [Nanoarchaeota archaeon]